MSKIICEDIVDYDTEKNYTDYTLDSEKNTLEIHTLCRIKGVGSSHTTKVCQLTEEQAQMLSTMSEEKCKAWCLTNQSSLPVISRSYNE